MIKYIIRKIKLFIRSIRLSIFKRVFRKDNCEKIILGKNFIENNRIKSIVIGNEGGKTGDTVIITPIFREIKKSYPDIKLSVIQKGISREILEYNPYIYKIYDFDDSRSNDVAKEIKEGKYDLYICIREGLKEKDAKFIKQCGARFNFGINKKDWKLFDISVDQGIDFSPETHKTEVYKKILEVLGVSEQKNIDTSYEIFFDDKRKSLINDFTKHLNKKNTLVINPYGSREYRWLSKENIRNIIECFTDWNVILLYYGEKKKDVESMAEGFENVIVPENINGVLDAAAYTSIADVVVTPDTSISHIASAFDKEIVIIYAYPKEAKDNNLDIKIFKDFISYAGHSKKPVYDIFCDTKIDRHSIDNHYININDYNKEDLDIIIKKIKNKYKEK